MKIAIIFLLMISLLGAVDKSDACTPPLQQYSVQAIELKALFSDPEVEATIFEYVGQIGLVESVQADKGIYTIELSNICKVLAKPIWKNQGGGACPKFEGFEIMKATCNE